MPDSQKRNVLLIRGAGVPEVLLAEIRKAIPQGLETNEVDANWASIEPLLAEAGVIIFALGTDNSATIIDLIWIGASVPILLVGTTAESVGEFESWGIYIFATDGTYHGPVKPLGNLSRAIVQALPSA